MNESSSATGDFEKNFLKRYELIGVLGRGGYGSVYAAKRIHDSLPVAVKFIQNFTGKMDPVDSQIPLEVSLLQRLSHIKGVVKLIETYRVQNSLFIIMERSERSMDLRQFIKQKRLTPTLTQSFFRQLVTTVRECHIAGVIHRDIKPQNIVVDLGTNTIKLIDFGCASDFKEFYDEFSGTRTFMPPEIFRDHRCNGLAAETWSLGVTLFYMVTGRPLYENVKQLRELETRDIPLPMDVNMQCRDLLRDLLRFDWIERISLEEALLHPYLLNYRSSSNNRMYHPRCLPGLLNRACLSRHRIQPDAQ